MQKQLSVLAVIVIAMSLSSVSHAQIEKGKFVAGGEISYYKKFYPSSESSSSTGSFNKYSSSYRNFDTGINLGYMISERMEVGLYFNYQDHSSSSRSEDWHSFGNNKSISKTLGFGPSFRYYQPIVEKVYFFGQLQSGFNNVKNEYRNSNIYKDSTDTYTSKSTRTYTTISTSLTPGVMYMPIKWLSIEVLFGRMAWSQNSQGGESATSDFGFNLDLRDLYIGTRLYF
ncbi:MAG TPA: hypothetical protein VD908_00155 [Cytophagales bacterium]|nr:hypothetical protein [Cytophagales bacterium]